MALSGEENKIKDNKINVFKNIKETSTQIVKHGKKTNIWDLTEKFEFRISHTPVVIKHFINYLL